MFRPSNPNDRHLTALELQDWERQRDEKKEDFPFIQLKKAELELLKKVSQDLVIIDGKNRAAVIRLRDFDFARIYSSNNPDKGRVEICEIRKRGTNYLCYLDGETAAKRSDRIHDWSVAAFSALAGAFLSQPLWGLIHWIADYFK